MVQLAGSVLASEVPRRSPRTGSAISVITARDARAVSTLCRSTRRAQREPIPCGSSRTGPLPASAARSRRESTFGPRKPSSAGSRVRAVAMVSATVTAAAADRPSRKLTPSANWPSSATHTVRPANSTVRPEVFTASAAASA